MAGTTHAMLVVLATLAISLVAVASVAYGQVGLPAGPVRSEPRNDPQPFYAPYTGPGFGNPDSNATPSEPVGRAREKYHDATGSGAYWRDGKTGPDVGKPSSVKKQKRKPPSKPASPPASETRKPN